MKTLPKFFVYVLIAGLLVTASMTMKHKFLHFSEHAPLGIVSLELAGNNDKQKQILTEWDRAGNFAYERDYGADVVTGIEICGVKMASKQILADYAFIPFYVLLLILLFSRYKVGGKLYEETQNDVDDADEKDAKAKKKPKFLSVTGFWVLTVMVIVAGLCDVVENIFLQRSISLFNRGLAGEAQFVAIPAWTKFILLAIAIVLFIVLTGALKRFSVWLMSLSTGFVDLLHFSWTFRIVLILLLVLFALLNFSDQGQDLLVTINNSPMGTFIFLASISVLAAMNWYLPKLYVKDPKKLNLIVEKGTSFSAKEKKPLDYARLLGMVTFFIPAVGMLKTMQQYHIPYFLDDVPALALLAIAIWVTISLINGNLITRYFTAKGKLLGMRYVSTMLTILVLTIVFYFFQHYFLFGKLSFLCADLFLISIGFLLTISLRTEIEKRYNFNMAFLVIAAGIFFGLVFILFNITPILLKLTAWDRFFTLSVVIWALITYGLLFSYLLALGNKWRIQIITILLFVCVAGSVNWISDFHHVEVVQKKDAKRDSLEVYVRNWLDSNQTAIADYAKTDSSGYPVFFVNSYGGGIRASAWASMVVGALDEKVLKGSAGNLKDDFQHHVFSYSGASGGTIGFSLLCAFRASGIKPDSMLYRKDYLTGNVVGIFGRDMLMSVLGKKWYPDRARLQEMILTNSLQNNYKVNYDMLLTDLYPLGATKVPLLFSNTYDINTGMKGIVAPVLLRESDFPSVVFIQDLIPGEDLPLSAASFLSARFPFVSPTGKFDEQHHFTDGGTLENSGAQTSLQVIEVFERVSHEAKYSNLKLSINILSLSNSVPSIDYPHPEKNLFEVAAPALGILKTIHGNAVRADRVNEVVAKMRGWTYTKLSPTEHKIKKSWPVLPLGWQISDDALAEMVKSIDAQSATLDQVLVKVLPKK
jgi:hypothetical protein